MKKLALLMISIAVPSLLAQTQPLPGRYFTPTDIYESLSRRGITQSKSATGKPLPTEREAQFYLMGVYDLSQETGQSCASRGTTKPEELEQAYTSYMDAHPIPHDTLATHAQLQTQTAASVAQRAFIETWPCQK
jgi:hypothetical protein